MHKKRNESDDDFLARVTHLRLHNKGISTLDGADVFDACPSLKVLYLYDNRVETLKGLERLRQMEQLYVDNNMLTTVDGTLPCRRLIKLHLSGNNISTLSGLEAATCLEELHVAKQRLPRGQCFTIDRASIDGIKDTLVLLDTSGNGMGGTEIEALFDLYRLETLNLADNEVEEMSQVVDLVNSLEVLRSLDLRGNVVSRRPKFFERTVTRCGDCLETLDGKPVHAQHRVMLQRLDQHKRAEARKCGQKAPANGLATHAPMAEFGAPREAVSGAADHRPFARDDYRRRQQDTSPTGARPSLQQSDPPANAGVRFSGDGGSVDGKSSGQPPISWPGGQYYNN